MKHVYYHSTCVIIKLNLKMLHGTVRRTIPGEIQHLVISLFKVHAKQN